MTEEKDDTITTKAIAVAAVIIVGAVVLIGVDYSQTRDRAQANQIGLAEMKVELKNLSGALEQSTEATKSLTKAIERIQP